jgi:hypothetical protein
MTPIWEKERKELRDIQRSTRKVVKQGERLLKKSKGQSGEREKKKSNG